MERDYYRLGIIISTDCPNLISHYRSTCVFAFVQNLVFYVLQEVKSQNFEFIEPTESKLSIGGLIFFFMHGWPALKSILD